MSLHMLYKCEQIKQQCVKQFKLKFSSQSDVFIYNNNAWWPAILFTV